MTDPDVSKFVEESIEDNPDNTSKSKAENVENKGTDNEVEINPHSRELKQLLALSKEAKLETNLSRKRKSLEHRKGGLSTDTSNKSTVLKNLIESKHVRYPVTAESELESDYHNNRESKAEEIPIRNVKKKKLSLSNVSVIGAVDEGSKKRRKSLTTDILMFKPNKDMFCWRCHRDGVNISCETCTRSYHQKCLKQIIDDPDHWPCPECVSILKAESTQSRSTALKGMTLEHLCSLLKFAVNRMIQCQGSEPFIHPVNPSEFPDYKKYIIQPMDLTLLEKNIKENLYGSTQAFEADAKWILHNSIIFNSYQSKLTTVAKSIIKVCKQEMAEIENCPTCYLNANTKKNTWFVEVCPKPHLLVWAKLRGFPYWPGKVMTYKDNMVDVRFFGAHDRAWVPEKECFLYSQKDPNGFRQRRADIEQCIEELNVHIENLKKAYGEFCFPAFKTPINPDNELEQLQEFLPQYGKSTNRNNICDTTDVMESGDNPDSDIEMKDKKEDINKDKSKLNDEEIMEGYGTDDETIPEINTEKRKVLLINSKNDGKTVVENEDTQISNNIRGTFDCHENLPTKGALKSFPSESETTNENGKVDEKSTSPSKLSRRNSEAKSDSSRFSNISDKLNTVDVVEQMEISLGNHERPCVSYLPNNSDNSGETEIKKRPIQIDLENTELTLSPPNKLKIVDKLMKRLSNEDDKIKKNLEMTQFETESPEEQDEVVPERQDIVGDDAEQNNLNAISEVVESVNDEQLDVNSSSKESVSSECKMSQKDIENISVNNESLKQNASRQNDAEAPVKGKQVETLIINDEKMLHSYETVDEAHLKNKFETEPRSQSEQENDSDDKRSPANLDDSNEVSTTSEIKTSKTSRDSDDSEDEDIRNSNDIEIDKENIMNVIHSSLSDHSSVEITPSIEEIEKDTLESDTTVESRKRKLNEHSNERNNKLRIISDQKLTNNISVNNNNDTNEEDRPNRECSVLLHALKSKEVPCKYPTRNISSDGSAASIRISSDTNIEEIKSEPETDVEILEADNFEAKKQYLSALNILERKSEIEAKTVRNEIRTRSKVEEKRERNRIADNLTRVIDSVATNYRNGQCNESISEKSTSVNVDKKKGENGEIFVKSFAKLVAGSKARARKSFPYSYTSKFPNKTILKSRDEIRTQCSKGNTESNNPPKDKPPNTAHLQTVSTQIDLIQPNKSYLIVKQPATPDLILLPSNQSINYSSPKTSDATLVTTTPSSVQAQVGPATVSCNSLLNIQKCIPSYLSVHTLSDVPRHPNVSQCVVTSSSNQFQNLNSISSGSTMTTTTTVIENVRPGPIINSQTATTISNSQNVTDIRITDTQMVESVDDDEFRILNNLIPEGVNKVVSELVQRPPPKLKPRPPGMLSTIFSEGPPSSAGGTTAKINSVAHRLSDYFRGMLIETLNDLGKSNNADATITSLKLEIESLKHKHSIELSEIEKNMCTILKDIQKSIIDDRERIIEETRAACEAETVKRIEEAKSKQWCASCSKEAQFYCCWNTSYCDYPCQQKHWPTHMSKCTQNINNSGQNSQTGLRSLGQQLILRPTVAPSKMPIGRTAFTKPVQKVYLNRNMSPSKTLRVQTPSGNFLTVMETSPGSYQLMGNSVVRTSQGMTNIKCSNVTPLTSSSITFSQQKAVASKPAKVLSHSIPVSTVMEDDSD